MIPTLPTIPGPQGPGSQGPDFQGDPVDRFGQLPELASGFTEHDELFYFVTAICAFFFLLILAILVYSVVKYRRKTIDQPPASNITHHTMLEVVWTVIPLIIVMVIFAWGWKGSLRMGVVPSGALEYKVVASQWSWSITHPGDTAAAINEMYVPVGKDVAVTMESRDVLHSFYIPAFRVKRDVLPGRQQQAWFRAERAGTYRLFCAEYCGQDHSTMRGLVHVVSQEDYDEQPWRDMPAADAPLEDRVAYGETVYSGLCIACHSTDGTNAVGPTFLNLWGTEEQVYEGTPGEGEPITVTVNEEYVRESIREPDAKLVAENPLTGEPFPPGMMTPFDENQIPEEAMQHLFAFLRSLQEDEELREK